MWAWCESGVMCGRNLNVCECVAVVGGGHVRMFVAHTVEILRHLISEG